MQIRTFMLIASLTAPLAGCDGSSSQQPQAEATFNTGSGDTSNTPQTDILPDQTPTKPELPEVTSGEPKVPEPNKDVVPNDTALADAKCQPFAPIKRDAGENSPFVTDCSRTRIVRSLSNEPGWKFFFDTASTDLDKRFGNGRTEGAVINGTVQFDRTALAYDRNLMPTADLAHPTSQSGFNDATWEAVTLPHTWNRYGRYCREDTRLSRTANGTTSFAASRMIPQCNAATDPEEKRQQGQGWYRLRFNSDATSDSSQSFLEFDGVGNVADVWLNDQYLGRHNGAFTRFRFDVSNIIKPEGNILAVRADNTLRIKSDTRGDGNADKDSRWIDNPTSYVLPLSGDFTVNGGIYRNVNLIQTKTAAHFDVDVTYGGPGVFVSAAPKIAVSGQHEADIGIQANIVNKSDAKLSLGVRLSDADGKQPRVLSVSNSAFKLHRETGNIVSQEPISDNRVTVKFRIADAKLWEGIKNPYLYRVTVDLFDEDGTIVDSVTQPLGIRSIAHDNGNSRNAIGAFELNGKTQAVYGVSRHQDWLDQGWALSKENHDTDMALIREMGANAVRFAHYQHDPRWFQLADSFGMMVWAEIPYIDGACVAGSRIDRRVIYNAKYQMQELVRQNYNSPSVMWWGLSNETGRASGGACNALDTDLNHQLRFLATSVDDSLNPLFKESGTSRPTVIATNQSTTMLQDVSDEIAYNHYPGWYDGSSWLTWMRSYINPRLEAKRRAIGISEYGAGGTHFQHTDANGRVTRDLSFASTPVAPFNATWESTGHWHPVENQTFLHQTAWATIGSNLCGYDKSSCQLWGSFIWNMFDFASYFRAEGGLTNINNKGLVSMDRKHKKDAFYFYKSAWNQEEKFIHLASKDYKDRDSANGRDADGLFRVEVFGNIGSLPDNLNLEITGTGAATPVDFGKCKVPRYSTRTTSNAERIVSLDNVCVWDDLKLAVGQYNVKVTANVDGKSYQQDAVWNVVN